MQLRGGAVVGQQLPGLPLGERELRGGDFQRPARPGRSPHRERRRLPARQHHAQRRRGLEAQRLQQAARPVVAADDVQVVQHQEHLPASRAGRGPGDRLAQGGGHGVHPVGPPGLARVLVVGQHAGRSEAQRGQDGAQGGGEVGQERLGGAVLLGERVPGDRGPRGPTGQERGLAVAGGRHHRGDPAGARRGQQVVQARPRDGVGGRGRRHTLSMPHPGRSVRAGRRIHPM
ncbi:hypothetical protein K7G98_13205 [Saccharothrix sp. MB29]|nr:hypothetical protein [Saccharothrix sp. MB29]